MATTGTSPRGLTRDAWLDGALEVLAREGDAKLTIDRLTRALGVSKGSFYWHFDSRGDFVDALVDYWSEWSTEAVIEALAAVSDDPHEQLRAIMRIVIEQDITAYDVPFRSWAAHDPQVSAGVRAVDRRRLQTVTRLLGELGFEGDELAARARLFATFLSLEPGFLAHPGKAARLRHADRILELIAGG